MLLLLGGRADVRSRSAFVRTGASPLPPKTVIRMTKEAEQLRMTGKPGNGTHRDWLKRARDLALELARDGANRSGVTMNYDAAIDAFEFWLKAFAYYVVRPEDQVREEGARRSEGRKRRFSVSRPCFPAKFVW